MAQLKTVTKILYTGIEALNQIEKPFERATAAAALLSSLAQIRSSKAMQDDSEETEVPVEKEGSRLSLVSDETVVEESVAAAPSAEETPAVDAAEWTEEALDYKGIVDTFAEQCGKELINDHYNYFTKGERTTIDDLSPLDVGAFVAYLYEQQSAEEQAQ